MKIKGYSFLIVTLVISIVSCKQHDAETATITVHGQPSITFEEMIYDFDTIRYNGDGTYKFRFSNTGDQPLIIQEVKSSCGCTVPKYSNKPYLPGENGFIKVKYDTRRKGRFHKTIRVYTNAEEFPVSLKIQGVVREP